MIALTYVCQLDVCGQGGNRRELLPILDTMYSMSEKGFWFYSKFGQSLDVSLEMKLDFEFSTQSLTKKNSKTPSLHKYSAYAEVEDLVQMFCSKGFLLR